MNPKLREAFKWFAAHGGSGQIGHTAESSLDLARSEIAFAERDDLRFRWEPEDDVDIDDLDTDPKAQSWLKRELDGGRLTVEYLVLEQRVPAKPKCSHCGLGPDPEHWQVADSLGMITLHVKSEREDRRHFEAEMASQFFYNEKGSGLE